VNVVNQYKYQQIVQVNGMKKKEKTVYAILAICVHILVNYFILMKHRKAGTQANAVGNGLVGVLHHFAMPILLDHTVVVIQCLLLVIGMDSL